MAIAPSGPTVGYRNPDPIPRGVYRCKGGLAATTATSSGGILYEIVPVFGSARVRVRAKTATNGGTLDFFFVGPDFDIQQGLSGVAYASLTGTVYTTGGGTQITLAAATENTQTIDLYGEGYLLLKFTGTVGAGTITFVDVSQV